MWLWDHGPAAHHAGHDQRLHDGDDLKLLHGNFLLQKNTISDLYMYKSTFLGSGIF